MTTTARTTARSRSHRHSTSWSHRWSTTTSTDSTAGTPSQRSFYGMTHTLSRSAVKSQHGASGCPLCGAPVSTVGNSSVQYRPTVHLRTTKRSSSHSMWALSYSASSQFKTFGNSCPLSASVSPRALTFAANRTVFFLS